MTHNLDPNNVSPFGLIYPEDAPFGSPIVVELHEVSSGEVPPYENRAEILLGDAHAILLAIETSAHAPEQGAADLIAIVSRELPNLRRWLDRYELHLCQIDHPDLRHERPLGVPPTIDGEVKDDANERG